MFLNLLLYQTYFPPQAVHKGVKLELTELGFRGNLLKKFNSLLRRPHGVILVTGPTGSGKTTTLYAALEQLNSPECKILTVEDPVEYQLKGINQIQVQSQINLTFAKVLRSILRQDPDIIMIGEMRDTETARIAIQSALTGHKVFSTLHTNDAPSSITRLLDMNIEPYLLTSTIDGVLAQRLVRKLCRHCRQPLTLAYREAQSLGLKLPSHQDQVSIYQGQGCKECDHTGYKGRTTVLELLELTDAVKSAITQGSDADQIRAAAKTSGFKSMQEDGMEKVLQGLTSLEEITRVTKSDTQD